MVSWQDWPEGLEPMSGLEWGAVGRGHTRTTPYLVLLSFDNNINRSFHSLVISAFLSVPDARLNVPWGEKILSWLQIRF